MLLRTLLLLLFSSPAFSASICISIDLTLEIETIRYVGIEESQGNGALEPLESIETLNSVDRCNMDEVLTFTAHTNGEISMLLKDQDGIRYVYNEDGEYLDTVIPPLSGSDFTAASFAYNKIYAYDREDQVLYLWDASSNAWIDASTVYQLPQGEYSNLFTVGLSTYISINSGENQGIWKIAEIAEKISGVSMNQGHVLVTHNGLAQAINDYNGRTLIYYLETALSPRIFDLNGYSATVQAFQSESGTLFYFIGPQDFKLYWDGINNFTDGYISRPEKITLFKGCFGIKGGAVCGFISDEGKAQFYRIEGKQMVLDSEIDSLEFKNIRNFITGYFISGEYRYITVINSVDKEHLLYRYSTSDGLEVVSRITVEAESSYSSILNSPIASEFLWFIRDEERKGIYRVKLSTFKEPEDIIDVDEEIDEPLEEREETAGDEEEPRPRAELSGAISMYYLFAMMLVLLVGRRKA